jgi:hypothetical protein
MRAQIAYVFIVNLFAPLAYGSLHFNKRMFLRAWILLSCALADAMRTVGAQSTTAYESVGGWLLFWGVISIALGRFLAVHAEILQARRAQPLELLRCANQRRQVQGD